MEQELEELERRHEELARELKAVQRMEEQLRELAKIQRHSQERIERYERRLSELTRTKERDEPLGPVRAERTAAVTAYVNACRAVDLQVRALDGAHSLQRARELLEELEVLHAEYEMVTEPRLSAAARMQEMAHVAAELDNEDCLAILKELEGAQAEHLKATRESFELWKRQRAQRRQLEVMAKRFWQEVEQTKHEGHEDVER
jgi:hypothetical protein